MMLRAGRTVDRIRKIRSNGYGSVQRTAVSGRSSAALPTRRSPVLSAVLRAACAALVIVPGCGQAPSVNILGSFFPAWLISIITGVVLTVLARQVFIATAIAPYLRPATLVYPSLACLFTFATRLILFAS